MHSPAPAVSISQAKRPIALAVRGLAKRFDRPAVDALDLTVYGGEFYVLVGPNGAGKTTTLRMVAGLLRPDAGSITIDGIDALADPVAAKQITAWLSDEPMIYDKLTPFEYLEFVAGLWRIEAKPAEARARRRHRDHDHAYSRSRRAHGRPHRRHRQRALDRRGHARGIAPQDRENRRQPGRYFPHAGRRAGRDRL